MKTPFFYALSAAVLLSISLSSAVSAQQFKKNDYAGPMPDLQGVVEPFSLNGQPGMRILTRKSGSPEIRFEKRDGQDSLVFMVTKFKSFGLGIQPEGEGKLYISRERVVYEPFADRVNFFSANRADLKGVDLKGTGIGLDVVLFELNADKKRFAYTGTQYLNRRDLKTAMTYLYHAVIDFDGALNLFNQQTAGVRAAADPDEEPEDEPVSDISDKYDRFRDITIVSTAKMVVRGPRRSIRMQASFTYPGETFAKPNTIFLTFNISGANPIFNEDDLSLNFLVDKQRVPLGNMKMTEEKGKSVTRQTLTVSMPYEIFVKLAEGKKVEFQAGTLEYKLEPVHIEAFKNLASFKPEEK